MQYQANPIISKQNSDSSAAIPRRGPSSEGAGARTVVLHVTDTLGQGGAEQNLHTVLKCLPEERFTNHLAWLYPEDERLLETFRPHVASATGLRSGHGVGHLLAAARLSSLIRDLRVQVVHAQLIRAQIIARLAARVTGVPVVTTWQNTNYHENSLSAFRGSQLQRSAIRMLDKWTGRRDGAFVAVSEFVRDHSCDALGVAPERVTVIPNALHPERYEACLPGETERVRRELGVDANTRVLLAAGRLVGQKDQRTAVLAVAALVREGANVVLWIAGEGPERAALTQQIADLGIAPRVRLLGMRRDIRALFQAADVFVFPSLYEGLPVALVEALANGLPAVVSDIPPHREVARSASPVRFHPPGDAHTLALSIKDVLADHERLRRDAQALSEEIRNRYAAPKMANELGNVLARVAAGGRRT